MNKAFVREPDSTDVLCPLCGGIGEPVPAAALPRFITTEQRRTLADSVFFCPTPRCEAAYFDALEAHVPAAGLLRPVYPKSPSAPLCGCFGLTLDEVERDIAEGSPTRIRELNARSKTAAADCEHLSPIGRCCLPDVQRAYFKLRGGA